MYELVIILHWMLHHTFLKLLVCNDANCLKFALVFVSMGIQQHFEIIQNFHIVIKRIDKLQFIPATKIGSLSTLSLATLDLSKVFINFPSQHKTPTLGGCQFDLIFSEISSRTLMLYLSNIITICYCRGTPKNFLSGNLNFSKGN